MELALYLPVYTHRHATDIPRVRVGFQCCVHQRKRNAFRSQVMENNPKQEGGSEKKIHSKNQGRSLNLFATEGRNEKEIGPK
jgi:hypothetical protein